jgi:hypothetical protein
MAVWRLTEQSSSSLIEVVDEIDAHENELGLRNHLGSES